MAYTYTSTHTPTALSGEPWGNIDVIHRITFKLDGSDGGSQWESKALARVF